MTSTNYDDDDIPPFDFDDRAWRRFPQRTHDELKLVTNDLYYHSDAKVGALVAKGGKYPEIAVSTKGLDYLCAAVQRGDKIASGVVVLARRDEVGRPFVVKEMAVADVKEAVKNIAPRNGQYGFYWWFYSDGTPQPSQSTPTSYPQPLEDPPF
jgi:hypothetical protein